MMTISFDEGRNQIEIPQSWSEICLGDYEKWFQAQPTTKLEQVKFIADICKIEADVLLESPAQLFTLAADALCFVFEDETVDAKNSVTIDGVDYQVSFSDELTLAEWVDIESVFESESDSRLSEILSILCRPSGEVYNTKRSESRKPVFAALSMDKALPLLTFFLLRNEQSEKISNLYSEVLDQAALYLDHIRSSAENGDGTRSLPIWQRIKFYYLTKYLEKKLSKFSVSSSTKSIKTGRKKIRKNFKRA